MKFFTCFAFCFLFGFGVFIPFPASSQGSSPALVLTQKDGSEMFMACLRGGQKRLYDRQKAAECTRLCNFFRQAMHSDIPYTEIEEASAQCRKAYREATGQDIEPSVPSTYKPPEHSAR